MYFYTSASTIFNMVTIFINSRYLVHILYKKRITFLWFWISSGYLIILFEIIYYKKKYIENNKICFLLTLIPSFILGTSYTLWESAILAYLSNFPKNLIGGFSNGTGLSGLFSALLNFASQYYPNLRPKTLFLFFIIFRSYILILFLFTERIPFDVDIKEKSKFISDKEKEKKN